MIKILSLLKEIIKSHDKKTDEQPDTTNMLELESEECCRKTKSTRRRSENINTKPIA